MLHEIGDYSEVTIAAMVGNDAVQTMVAATPAALTTIVTRPLLSED